MSDNVKVTLSRERVVINPGEQAELTAVVRNDGEVVEVFAIEVQGLEKDWYTLSVTSVSLFPGDKDTLRLVLSPPSTSSSAAGNYTATLKATSRRDAGIFGAAEFVLEMGRISSYEADLSPKKVTGRRGNFQVTIGNTGNLPNTYKLQAVDPENCCSYDFKPETLVVDAGSSESIVLSVVPKKRPFTGAGKVVPFSVTITPLASEVKTLQGQFEYPAVVPRWGVMAAGMAVVALVVVLVLVMTMGTSEASFKPVNTNVSVGPQGYAVYGVFCNEVGTLEAGFEWASEERMSLVLVGPAGAEVARAEGDGPLTISHTLATADLAAGDTWKVYVANLDPGTAVSGRVEITFAGEES